ncbi:quinone oxidoreductase family protein [Micromonospora sp. WMMD558]|uniref:quinone oxidoreductase family protein n=1 Tax=unclassified Micromonospora TaxID=2617518 RepID=UPI0012B46898|nr:quinone oxidoreductase [Micromonospora sp. WMMC415]QGN46778.1 zinc-binding dehydrogenase [Micromonospora sp. WMMC415]
MRAVEVTRYGEPSVLTLTEREPDPLPAGHVRVHVAAVGVNFIDVYQRTGAYPRPLPFVLGGEGAGRVVEIGPQVTGFEIGQRVAWQGVPGSYAEQVVAPVWQLIPVPDGVSDEQAAALPMQGLTAHYLATTSYRIQPGDHVVIHAGAGGVGLLLTQLAKLLGAKVYTTVSTKEKAELSLAAGADEVVGYADFDQVVRRGTSGLGAAAAYDGVGRATFEKSLSVLAVRGSLVLFGQSSGPVPPFDLARLGQSGSLTVTRPTLRDFVATPAELLRRSSELWRWLSDGRLEVHIGRTFRLTEASLAHEELQARRTTGKVLLLP